MKYQMTGNSKMVVGALLAVCLVFGMVQIGLAARHDFNGETVTFFTVVDHDIPPMAEYFAEGPNLVWLQEVEEMFNVKIEFNSTFRGQFIPEVVAGMIAGDPPGDIFWTRLGFTKMLAAQGMIEPLYGIIDDEYYQRIPSVYRNKDFYELVGTPYAFSSNDNPQRDGVLFNNPQGVVWNKQIFEELDLPNLYELQESGDWTYEALIDIASQAQRDTTGDGEIDLWGVGGMSRGIHWHQLAATMVSNDATWVRIDEDGRATVNVTDPAFLDALQLWQDLKMIHNATGPVGRGTFAGGNMAMMVSDMTGLMLTRDNEAVQDWGWVFYPKGPNAEDYVAVTHMFYVGSLALGAKNPEALVELASALWRSTEEYMDFPMDDFVERGLDLLARDGFIADRESYETFRRMYNNMNAMPFFRDFFVNQPGAEQAFRDIRDGLVYPATAMAELQPALQAALDEYLGQ